MCMDSSEYIHHLDYIIFVSRSKASALRGFGYHPLG